MIENKFKRALPKGFYRTLRTEVNKKMNELNEGSTGGTAIKWKSGILFALYFTPLLLLFFSLPVWAYLGLWLLSGIGMAGIGMAVMHDAAHGSYSKKKYVNNLLSKSIVLLCGNKLNWSIQHNLLHHTYTNVEGRDEDMDAGMLIRLHPEQKPLKIHKYQYLYAPVLYALLTLNWFLLKDYQQLVRYQRMGLITPQGRKYKNEWIKLVLGKFVYALLLIGLPLAFHPQHVSVILSGFVIMHLSAGTILSWVFQLAHAMEPTKKFANNEKLSENEWAEHQLLTTINFSTSNKLITWFTGGLNHQVEHHLFPNISHVHYARIAPAVKKIADEFNMPYIALPNLKVAIWAHLKYLKLMGAQPLKTL